VGSLEQELQTLKQRQAELRLQIRRMRNSQSEIGKLEEKLQKQLASAKWTAGQIREIRPDWDEFGFYQSVQAKQPSPRGRRRRTPSEE
jgi:chromosome segregation ATPase